MDKNGFCSLSPKNLSFLTGKERNLAYELTTEPYSHGYEFSLISNETRKRDKLQSLR